MSTGVIYLGLNGRGVKLIAHLHLVRGLIMNGVLLLLLYALVACTGNTLRLLWLFILVLWYKIFKNFNKKLSGVKSVECGCSPCVRQ